jgi:hypothetical protein
MSLNSTPTDKKKKGYIVYLHFHRHKNTQKDDDDEQTETVPKKSFLPKLEPNNPSSLPLLSTRRKANPDTINSLALGVIRSP